MCQQIGTQSLQGFQIKKGDPMKAFFEATLFFIRFIATFLVMFLIPALMFIGLVYSLDIVNNPIVAMTGYMLLCFGIYNLVNRIVGRKKCTTFRRTCRKAW